MRKLFRILAVTLSIALAAPLTATAAPDDDRHWFHIAASSQSTSNLATERFATPVGAVSLNYWCWPSFGNTRVQLVAPNQLTAYRDFPAICDNKNHDLGYLAVGSNTAMRARLHNYSGEKFYGWVEGGCPTCYFVGN